MKRFLLIFLSASFIWQLNLTAQTLNISPGQMLETVTSSKMNMKIESLGQAVEMENITTSQVEFKAVTDSGFLFINTIKRMVITGNSMGQDIRFDSDKPEDLEGSMGNAFKNAIGSSQNIAVDKQGKITNIEGSVSMPEGLSDLGAAGQMTKGQLYPLISPMTKKNLKPGATWSDSSIISPTNTAVYNYTLKPSGSSETILSFTGKMDMKMPVKQQGMEVEMILNGNLSGDSFYDKTSGLLKKNSTISDVKGSVGFMGQTIPMKMLVNTTITVNKL